MSVERIRPANQDAWLTLTDAKRWARVDGDYEDADFVRMIDAVAREAEDYAQIALLDQTIRILLPRWPRGHVRLPMPCPWRGCSSRPSPEGGPAARSCPMTSNERQIETNTDPRAAAELAGISKVISHAAVCELGRALQKSQEPGRTVCISTCAASIMRDTIGIRCAIDDEATADLLHAISAAMRAGVASDDIVSFQFDAQERLARAELKKLAGTA